jgi:trimethylamine:corrinoid methyltransferase-like protein
VEVTPEMIGMDEILSVGFGITSNHLFTEHTLHHYRDSFWLPQVVNRSGYAGFEDEKAILEKARKRVADLIATYEKPRVDPDKLAKMRQVVDRARKELLA